MPTMNDIECTEMLWCLKSASNATERDKYRATVKDVVVYFI